MKIRNSGSSYGSFGNGQSRSDSFRRKHRLGQKVRGILLKNIPDGMAWVSIGDDKLLAQLNSAHPEGARLSFVIKQLSPDIILKEIFETGQATGNTIGIASSFDTARTLFENKFHHELQSTFVSGATEFTQLLSSKSKLYAAFKDTQQCLSVISEALENAQIGQVLYQPWLTPTSRRQLTFIKHFNSSTTQLLEAIVEFEHTVWGNARVEFLFKNSHAGYKLKAQHLSHADQLKSYLAASSTLISESSECLGIAKLPPTAHGGILTELLFRSQ